MSAARVLLAGSTGTLGRALVPALAAAGCRVVALTHPRSRAKLAPLARHLSEVREALVTEPHSLAGVCDGVDSVVSALGITRQRDGLTPEAVDHQANLNLLREAQAAGVGHFAYVSVLGAGRPSGVPVIDAKHRFEQALRAGAPTWTIFRPSGFFTDLNDVLAMARRGRVWLIGRGEARITPVDVHDLAAFIAAHLVSPGAVLEAGGPDTLTWNELARLCFEVVGGPRRIHHLPVGLWTALTGVVRCFSPPLAGTMRFVAHVQTSDCTAPGIGRTRLHDHLARVASQPAAAA